MTIAPASVDIDRRSMAGAGVGWVVVQRENDVGERRSSAGPRSRRVRHKHVTRDTSCLDASSTRIGPMFRVAAGFAQSSFQAVLVFSLSLVG